MSVDTYQIVHKNSFLLGLFQNYASRQTQSTLRNVVEESKSSVISYANSTTHELVTFFSIEHGVIVVGRSHPVILSNTCHVLINTRNVFLAVIDARGR